MYKDFEGIKKHDWILGNNLLYAITSAKEHEVRFEITAWDGATVYANYGQFVVAGPWDKYRLTIGDYSGTAGKYSSN